MYSTRSKYLTMCFMWSDTKESSSILLVLSDWLKKGTGEKNKTHEWQIAMAVNGAGERKNKILLVTNVLMWDQTMFLLQVSSLGVSKIAPQTPMQVNNNHWQQKGGANGA